MPEEGNGGGKENWDAGMGTGEGSRTTYGRKRYSLESVKETIRQREKEVLENKEAYEVPDVDTSG